MVTTINIPDSLYEKSENLAMSRGKTVEQIIVEAVVKEVDDSLTAEPVLHCGQRVVDLPLIHSERPGTLDLSDFNFDDLLA
jgi:hypothetical protein